VLTQNGQVLCTSWTEIYKTNFVVDYTTFNRFVEFIAAKLNDEFYREIS